MRNYRGRVGIFALFHSKSSLPRPSFYYLSLYMYKIVCYRETLEQLLREARMSRKIVAPWSRCRRSFIFSVLGMECLSTVGWRTVKYPTCSRVAFQTVVYTVLCLCLYSGRLVPLITTILKSDVVSFQQMPRSEKVCTNIYDARTASTFAGHEATGRQ